MRHATRLLAVAVVTVALAAPASGASAADSGYFADDNRSVHEDQIEALAAAGITYGCDPGEFCPGQDVTRGQMAAFIVRAFRLPSTSRDWFRDDRSSQFQRDINRLRAAEITTGCNPPANDRFCPDQRVTRAQMAVFLGRAQDVDPSDRDWFRDDNGSQYEDAINALRAAGLTAGCNPPTNDRFCPGASVTRAQMASFLVRARGLSAPSGLSERMHPVVLRWNGLGVRAPSSGIELIGQHEANHDGARNLSSTGEVPSRVLASRGRLAGRRSAADIVGHPAIEVRAPVTGTVTRAFTYDLYCNYRDDLIEIRPDGRPDIRVKMLHIDGVRQRPGDRVRAGITVVARRPTVLPFGSQVDAYTSSADWPHVHIEVIDTNIPDKPGPGGGC